MIIVTGGAGFIGSNIVRHLNDRGVSDIVVVDDLTDGRKMFNLASCQIADYLDHQDFIARIGAGSDFGGRLQAVLHQGACTVTTEWDGRMMMKQNYEFSKRLLHYCLERETPFIYASSASVYGAGRQSQVTAACERPINVYAWSKLVFDQYVRRHIGAARSQVAGLRYFNVYGPNEQHKGGMASVIWHFHQQLLNGDEVRLFEGSGGFGDGEQRRDFIHVHDVAAVNCWLMGNGKRGIFNLGTGTARSFNDVARAVIAWHGKGRIRYIPFPAALRASYQDFTEADLSGLRAAGWKQDFLTIEEGVKRYLDALA
jgi:ADP-L-glycero-D-manno-heptose 6-epimerase